MSDLRQSNSSTHTPGGTCYSVMGDAEHVIVFIHGVGMNQHVWQPQIDYFCHNFKVVVYDMLGHGNSPQSPESAHVCHYTAQLNELLTFLQISKAYIVGHSTGALISVDFALQHAEKVRAIVPLNIVYKRTAEQCKAVLARADQVLKQQKITGIDATLDRWFANKTDARSQSKIDVIREYLSEVNPLGYGRTYKMFAESDRIFEDQLDQLDMPVLYLTGQDDPNSTKSMSEQMARETPNAFAQSIAHEAHMMAYISPDKVNPVIDQFLKQHL